MAGEKRGGTERGTQTRRATSRGGQVATNTEKKGQRRKKGAKSATKGRRSERGPRLPLGEKATRLTVPLCPPPPTPPVHPPRCTPPVAGRVERHGRLHPDRSRRALGRKGAVRRDGQGEGCGSRGSARVWIRNRDSSVLRTALFGVFLYTLDCESSETRDKRQETRDGSGCCFDHLTTHEASYILAFFVPRSLNRAATAWRNSSTHTCARACAIRWAWPCPPTKAARWSTHTRRCVRRVPMRI